MSESYKVYASQEYVDNKLNDVSGLPEDSGPNQYLVTDSEGDVRWEDKLCWSETAEEVVQPECHPELVSNEDIFNYFYIDGVASITVGETYIVNWNGVEYRCVAKTPDMVSYDAAPVYAILGNIAKIEETGDTGEPFLIRVGRYRDNYPSEYQIYAFDCATELTLSIRHYVETINKLSGKYVEGMGWSEKSTKEVLPETFVAEPAQQESGLNLYQINCALAGGKKYTVIYNGVAYDVISHAIDESTVLMGNFAVAGNGNDTGEPFLISYNSNLGGTMVGTLDSGGITIAIYEGEVEIIHPVDKKYLPSDFGLPSGAKPNQYIVTDKDGNAKWEDKLAWSEDGIVEILQSQTVEFAEMYGMNVSDIISTFASGLTVNEEYTVTWDGVEYPCVCIGLDNSVYLGNLSIMQGGEGTGEPFVVVMNGSDLRIATKETGSHMVSIVGVGEVIHPIDKKYLPKPLVINATTPPANNTAWGELNKMLCEAVSNGTEIKLDVYGTGELVLPCVAWDDCQASFIAGTGNTLVVYRLVAMPSDGGSLTKYFITMEAEHS